MVDMELSAEEEDVGESKTRSKGREKGNRPREGEVF